LLTAGTVLGAQGVRWAMQAILFGVPDLPPRILVGAIVIMTIVSLTACLLPARRATRVDPMTAFRGD
jgi:putative ABC transport system permease protein